MADASSGVITQDQPNRRPTDTAPVPGGPYETTSTPPWSADAANTDQWKSLAHEFGFDKDYLAEAKGMIPAPPQYSGLDKRGFAALIPGLALSALGGPQGLAAVGNAIGAAKMGDVKARQTNWENQYKYATGLGSLANAMQQRGTAAFSALAPYLGMKAYEAGTLQERDKALQAREMQWAAQNQLTEQRIQTQLTQIKGMESYHDQITAWHNASLEAMQAYHAGNLALASQRESDAQQYRSQLIGVATQRLQVSRDTQSINAAHDLINALEYEKATLTTAGADPARVNNLQTDIDNLKAVLNGPASQLIGPDQGGVTPQGPLTPGTYQGHPALSDGTHVWDAHTGKLLK